MTVRKICNETLARNIKKNHFSNKSKIKKIDLEEIPFTTIKVTMRMLKWIFLLIFIYMAISIIVLIVQGGDEQIRNIVVYSVSGFFTFFMGYFGWMFARNVTEIVSGKKIKEEEF